MGWPGNILLLACFCESKLDERTIKNKNTNFSIDGKIKIYDEI